MIGMMWFDNSKDDLAIKVRRAADYYRAKYGPTPNFCGIFPQATPAPAFVGDVAILETRQVLPNHFWIGVRTEANP